MARFKAPQHVTEAFLSSGPYKVRKDGTIAVPDDKLTEGDRIGLRNEGFEEAGDEPTAAEDAPADEGKPQGKAKA